jgi:hypothetical protein
MGARRLVLRKETLVEIGTEELALVAGAVAQAVSSPIGGCVTEVASKLVECDSTLRPCISHGCTL